MSRTLVLVRHGRTEWNATGRAQGQTDVPLDAAGLVQATDVADALTALGPVRLWSSDLGRARQTAEAIGHACGLSVVVDRRLREYDVGERSGLTGTEFKERFPAEYAAWLAGVDVPRVPGEESAEEVAARTSSALLDYVEELDDGTVGVAVMHGACLKTALGAVLGWPRARTDLAGLDNGSVAVLRGGPRSLRLAAYNVPPAGVTALRGPDFATRRTAR